MALTDRERAVLCAAPLSAKPASALTRRGLDDPNPLKGERVMTTITDTSLPARMQSGALVLIQLTSLATRHLPEVIVWELNDLCHFRIQGQLFAAGVDEVEAWADYLGGEVTHEPFKHEPETTRVTATAIVEGVTVVMCTSIPTPTETQETPR